MSATGKLKSWIQDRKDNSISFVLQKFVQKRLERYGVVRDLKIDSRTHTASIQILPLGEIEPVTVRIDEYQLTQHGAGPVVIILRASASRAWLTFLLEDFVVGKPLPIPEEYAGYVKMVL